MKRLKLLSALTILFMAIGFTSCDVEPIDPALVGEDPGNNAPSAFQVDFNGQTYQANTSQAAVLNGSIVVSAVKSDGSTFMITIPGTTVGTYTDATIMYTPNINAGGNFYINEDDSGSNGTVKITSINTTTHKITGTFNFTGIYTDETQADVVFTNGIFSNITYTGTIPEPTEPGDAFFKVKIDGTQYTADETLATVGNGLITVTGLRGTSGEYVSIVIDGITEGTYTEEALFAYSPDGTDEIVYSNISLSGGEDTGTVTITDIDTANHTISGTFSFTGYLEGSANKNFTEGSFENIPYTDETNTPTDEVFSAKVDGTNFNYAGTDLIVGTVDDDPDYDITLQGIDDNHQIRLFFNNTATVGNYTLSDGPVGEVKAWFKSGDNAEVQATSGTVVITSRENWITGTFSYSVAGHTVTNGVFNVEYDW